MYYFCWVSPDTVFDPALHTRHDEAMLNVQLLQTEGENAVAIVTLPYDAQLFQRARQGWAIISHDTGNGPQALFKGYVLHLPLGVQSETVTLKFIHNVLLNLYIQPLYYVYIFLVLLLIILANHQAYALYS